MIASRYYRRGKDEKWKRPDTKVKKVVDFVQGAVTLSGLGSMFVAIHHKAAESGFAIVLLNYSLAILISLLLMCMFGVSVKRRKILFVDMGHNNCYET